MTPIETERAVVLAALRRFQEEANACGECDLGDYGTSATNKVSLEFIDSLCNRISSAEAKRRSQPENPQAEEEELLLDPREEEVRERICSLIAAATSIALSEVERQARQILIDRPELKEFVMVGPHGWKFYRQDGARVLSGDCVDQIGNLIDDYNDLIDRFERRCYVRLTAGGVPVYER